MQLKLILYFMLCLKVSSILKDQDFEEAYRRVNQFRSEIGLVNVSWNQTRAQKDFAQICAPSNQGGSNCPCDTESVKEYQNWIYSWTCWNASLDLMRPRGSSIVSDIFEKWLKSGLSSFVFPGEKWHPEFCSRQREFSTALMFVSKHVTEIGCVTWASEMGSAVFGCVFGSYTGRDESKAHLSDDNFRKLCKLIPNVVKGCLGAPNVEGCSRLPLRMVENKQIHLYSVDVFGNYLRDKASHLLNENSSSSSSKETIVGMRGKPKPVSSNFLLPRWKSSAVNCSDEEIHAEEKPGDKETNRSSLFNVEKRLNLMMSTIGIPDIGIPDITSMVPIATPPNNGWNPAVTSVSSNSGSISKGALTQTADPPDSDFKRPSRRRNRVKLRGSINFVYTNKSEHKLLSSGLLCCLLLLLTFLR